MNGARMSEGITATAIQSKGERMDALGEVLNPIVTHPMVILAKNLFTLFAVVLWFAVVFWTWRDAYRRGAMAWFWALVALMFPVFGWIIYSVVRPPEYAEDVRERDLAIQSEEARLHREGGTCPSCLKPVDSDFLICPYCMKKLKKPCINCEKPLRLNWAVCPYCKTKQAQA